jgi:hypothetical protein
LCNVYFALYCVSNFCTCMIFTVVRSITQCMNAMDIQQFYDRVQLHKCTYAYTCIVCGWNER